MADVYNNWFAKILARITGYPAYAITLGQRTYFSCEPSIVHLAWHKHEDKHKEQWKRDGLLKFAILYSYYTCRYGYTNNPYEVEARQAEK